MRKSPLAVPLLILALGIPAAPKTHFLTDPAYRQRVEAGFSRQRQLAGNRGAALFGVFRQPLTGEEREALQFLFAGMPLNDLADQHGEYFLRAVRASLKMRRALPWGESVPEELFRHFVLPTRVNNENLDEFRTRMGPELMERVKGLSMRQAALEVNHWCHEKVAYRGSDSRTSAPLATMRTAFGRCGEESTFTVSALRAVCIPARQVYTPRWAHCDDNHAWVEAWVDGRWHYLGACEPEADLDMGWFREPARRVMLVHTKAYGPYQGGEPVVRATDRYAELNLTAHYAPVKPVTVHVVDREGRPVSGATVDFCLYNYAEFYPLASRETGADGTTSLETGLGDLLLWARKDGAFGFRKITVETAGTVRIALAGDPAAEYEMDLDLIPPIERPPLPAPVADGGENARRLKEEDGIRSRYMATFMDKESAWALADETGLDRDRVWDLVSRSMGNWAEIAAFIRRALPGDRPRALSLLGSISEKDLRDTPAETLEAHLACSMKASGSPLSGAPGLFNEYVLCPRVDNELLSPYGSYLQRRFPRAAARRARRDPATLASWVRTHVRIDETANHAGTPLTPRGVFELGVADSRSRDIFFVALCRSLGIPARLEPALRSPQYYEKGLWNNAVFAPEKPQETRPATGFVELAAGDDDPGYYSQFALARFSEGKYATLAYDEQPLSRFPGELELPVGAYMSVTGNRQGDGSVLARLAFFTLRAGERRKVPIVLRRSMVEAPSFGKLDLGAEFRGRTGSIALETIARGKGAILVWAGPGQEPTRHVMEDLRSLRETFEKWGGGLAFLLPAGRDGIDHGDEFQNIPGQSVVGTDADGALLRAAADARGHALGHAQGQALEANLPVIVMLDPEGRLLFFSAGYRIGIGEQLVKIIRRSE